MHAADILVSERVVLLSIFLNYKAYTFQLYPDKYAASIFIIHLYI